MDGSSGSSGSGASAAKRAASKKAAATAQGQPLKKAQPFKKAAKKTVPAKKNPQRPLPVTTEERAAAAARKKRADAAQRARTVAAGSPISHAPHKNRSRTTASRTTASRSGGLRPASTRPGSARPRAGSAGRGSRKRGFGVGNGRPVWVLGAVGAALALLILPYFQNWLVQRSELTSTRAEVGQATQDVADLEKQLERWKDDDYVRAQARERFDLVMPGENRYVVPDSTPNPESTPGPAATEVPGGNRSWFTSIWLSAEAAGAEGQAQATTEVP